MKPKHPINDTSAPITFGIKKTGSGYKNLLIDPAVSAFAKDIIRDAQGRDPVDVANDLEMLSEMAKRHIEDVQALYKADPELAAESRPRIPRSWRGRAWSAKSSITGF